MIDRICPTFTYTAKTRIQAHRPSFVGRKLLEFLISVETMAEMAVRIPIVM